jgi:predicted metal-dependent phosphoesterase TrpH
MRVDLHLHTWVSDGDLSPARVVDAALNAGLDVIAVTDHDTAAGVVEALEAAADEPIEVVPGIEVSCRNEATEFHILGYWIDPLAPSILAHQVAAATRRSTRMAAMIERLQGLGIGITYEDVQAAAGPTVRALGRPHLARALHAGRHTRFYGEAFLRFIGDSGPAFVAEGFPTPEAAIEVIHAAGGQAVWAHPPLAEFARYLPELVAAGLDGVECFRPGVEWEDTTALEAATRAHGLFLTGGSDWHGPTRFRLGDFAVDGSRVREVLAFGGVTP